MDLENLPSLPNAHQQIRLGDSQVSIQKWTAAIEYYLRAIEYFKTIQNTLQDNSLISIIQAQIAIKAERYSTITRAHSTSNAKPSTKINRIMPRHHTLDLENIVLLGGRGSMDSFAALIFPNNNSENSMKNLSLTTAKKNKKDDSQKMEELKMSYEALKTHLKAAFDDIERLKIENIELRMQRVINSSQQQIEFGILSTSHENKDTQESENELEVTI
ncbi:unnamed protein product [Rotaria sp. Silwood1]|nr:unnamed protein product [Rotaria sp. Silwood1]CAF3363246.1 unnamed protein product [Rotaria sp. Silwood1]CAF3385751.1 unnamed protein product [Rotaria sp. Silwood1]CAF4644471.1 unnamed protein product [Rotaria sp. Silwood1]CAF4775849.1 unnamed protein product [Rotaria sp. Silwood1]